jgi:hypothetical protein
VALSRWCLLLGSISVCRKRYPWGRPGRIGAPPGALGSRRIAGAWNTYPLVIPRSGHSANAALTTYTPGAFPSVTVRQSGINERVGLDRLDVVHELRKLPNRPTAQNELWGLGAPR